MTRLLVSVRSAAEAAAALAGGAQLIDVKEPTAGPLGAARPHVWREVHTELQGRTPLSVALGELCEAGQTWPTWPAELELANFAKFGLAGCSQQPWREQLTAAIRDFPAHTRPVFVAYADHEAAHAPPPQAVIDFAAQHQRCGGVLLDTYHKDGRDLLHHLPLAELKPLLAAIRRGGRLAVIAGGLNERSLRAIAPLAPDYFAVRGAACLGPRTGPIDQTKVSELAALFTNA